MVEPNRFSLFIGHVVWMCKQLLRGQVVSVIVSLSEPRLMKRLPKTWRIWLWARWEWNTCREFNDGPDDCYLPWKEFYKNVKKESNNR